MSTTRKAIKFSVLIDIETKKYFTGRFEPERSWDANFENADRYYNTEQLNSVFERWEEDGHNIFEQKTLEIKNIVEFTESIENDD